MRRGKAREIERRQSQEKRVEGEPKRQGEGRRRREKDVQDGEREKGVNSRQEKKHRG